MSRNNEETPDLRFSESKSLMGFTSAGIQGFNDLNPSAIVRELIQNSLDAVREDGRSKAIVRFELDEVEINDVPGIEAYRKSLKCAIRSQTNLCEGELPDPAAMVVNVMQSCLEKEKIDVLSVLDNGHGLDKKRMTGLLADGVSAKTSAGSGAVGNGHLTAIPASDLRYVLYGGISQEGNIASGQAILASFDDSNDIMMGANGYYTLEINSSSKNLYNFPTENFSPLISRKIDWIKNNFHSKKGTAVIIPGFNRFRESSNDLCSTIFKAASCSFFTAIADGDLEVIYSEGKNEKNLNNTNILKIFNDELKEKKQADIRGFISGNRAYEAYKTATEGQAHLIDVGCGEIKIVIRNLIGGNTRIDLCRNGMWITDRLPHLGSYKFTDKKPFHCLIKVKADDGEIHQLIRKSEGPLHNHIEAKKWLNEKERQKLTTAMKITADFLMNKIDDLQDEVFEVEDFLTLDETGISAGGTRGMRVGKFEPVPPRYTISSKKRKNIESDAGNSESKKKGNGRKNRSGIGGFRESGDSILFGATSVQSSVRSCDFLFYPQKKIASDDVAEIRFVLDEGIDETCDLTNDEQFVHLHNVRLNKNNVPKSDLIEKDGKVLGICLNRFDPGDEYILNFDYQLPDDIGIHDQRPCVLRAEIVCRRAKTEE